MSRVFLAAALALSSSAALAQTAPGTVGAPLGGPVVAGVCLLSQQAVLANAKVGVVATQRLQQLQAQAQAEVNAEREPAEADARALQTKLAKAKPGELAKEQAAVQARLVAVQQKADQRSRELTLTGQKANARIVAEEQPVIAAAYKTRNCGLLVNRDVVMGGNMAGDLTSDVVNGLDARMTTIAFDREILPPPAAK